MLDADGKAEADALPVPVLDAIVTDALDGLRTPCHRSMIMTVIIPSCASDCIM
jgi:hypothetical protein